MTKKKLKSFKEFVRDAQSKADADKGKEILKDVQDKLKDRVKKADGGMVLKEATDDRNRTPNKGVCRGGGAAIKGIKFSGVK
jgi:hypothetical protein